MRPTMLPQSLYEDKQENPERKEENKDHPIFGSIYSQEQENKIIMEALEKEKSLENGTDNAVNLGITLPIHSNI